MIDPIDVFRARCEARALLWQCGEYELHDAIDELQAAAEQYGLVEQLGQDAVQAMIAAPFEAVQEKIEAAPIEEQARPLHTARSTLDAAAWLWFQLGDVERFRIFLDRHSDQECAEIKQHIQNIKAKRNAANQR